METVSLIVAMLAAGFWIIAGVLLCVKRDALVCLKSIAVDVSVPHPKVSIIIPARNEERNICQALQSVLALDYPNLEICVVNDRSTDGTGSILQKMSQQDSRLKVQQIDTLPQGWLGKTHALQRAAQNAIGEFLLFADADIVFHPLALRNAMHYVQQHQLDHMTVIPEDTMPGTFLHVISATFGMFMFLLFQPWKARDPRSRRYMGIGAFNLVRTSVYHAIGGHEALRLRPDDDLKLGKLIKRSGYRQEVLNGTGMVSVEWYRSVSELIDGLMKNMFAGMEYRVSFVILATLGTLLIHLWPWVGFWMTSGVCQVWLGMTVLTMIGSFAYGMAPYGVKPWHGFLLPVTISLFLYIQWRATFLTLWNGGITWRGTHYSLAELKNNKV